MADKSQLLVKDQQSLSDPTGTRSSWRATTGAQPARSRASTSGSRPRMTRSGWPYKRQTPTRSPTGNRSSRSRTPTNRPYGFRFFTGSRSCPDQIRMTLAEPQSWYIISQNRIPVRFTEKASKQNPIERTKLMCQQFS